MGYRDEGGSRVRWFLAGVGFGAPLAMLYAPRSGRYTRATFLGRLLIRRETSFLSGGIVEDASELVERGRRYVRGYG